MRIDPEMGLYPISSVARMLRCPAKVLRIYEKNELIRPARSEGQRRLYSQKDLERLEVVHYLAQVKKVNLQGIRFILDMVPYLEGSKWAKIVEESAKALENLPAHEADPSLELPEN